ncbi:nucleoside diphosphate kinase regulator [Arenimonas fontis]|nr:nucleoside diphosphate kinase regulator [Arenimonas fontis]
MAELPQITVSSRDLARLEQLLESPELRRHPAAQALTGELNRATVLPPEEMPADVVTMNSQVTCVDESTGERHAITLVFPRDADAATGKVSVLAPVGSALLGLSVGQGIDWPGPNGRVLKLRVESIQYQPEAAGNTGA